ncbi:MAG: cytochrome c maturation protein CcmE [Henriciella sp.]
MRARTKRLYAVAGAGFLVAAATVLAGFALGRNADLFYTPELLAERGMPEENRRIRIGGFVQPDSLRYSEGVAVIFVIEDGSDETVTVQYDGILPDLFREEQGVVASGRFVPGSQLFEADQILAKHDENYQPRELRDIESSYSY